MTLTDEVLAAVRALASTIHHGSITIHLNAERNSVDIESVARERVPLNVVP